MTALEGIALNSFNPGDFGLKVGNLYEVIATTHSIDLSSQELEPNASCMGIRLLPDNLIQMNPFPNTTTYRNLKATGIITLNFVEDVYLYALASLKGLNSKIYFSADHYNYKEIEDPFDENLKASKISIPHVNSAWAILTCIIADEEKKTKSDVLGEFEVVEFKLHVISWDKIRESFKLFNRAENLALESIILATRLKVAREKSDDSLFNKIKRKIVENIDSIKRFGRNEDVLRAIEIVLDYVKST